MFFPEILVRSNYLSLPKLYVSMEDCLNSEDDYHYSDQESLDGFGNEDSDFQLVTTNGPTTQVFDYFVFFFVFLCAGMRESDFFF